MTINIAEVLGKRYPSYHEPFNIAYKLNRSSDPQDWVTANELLEGLRHRFSTVLRVWYEWAFNASKREPHSEELLKRLKEIHWQFRGYLDFDTWSLWGKWFKNRGQHLWKAAFAASDVANRQDFFGQAETEFKDAAEKYRAGAAVTKNPFPEINLWTIQFVLAALAMQLGKTDVARSYRAEVQAGVTELLQQAPSWKEVLTDDNIWSRATKAEAKLLLGDWSAAVELYRLATQQVNWQPHHAVSMRNQFELIFQAYELLGEPVPAEVRSQLETLFPVPNPK